MSPINDESYCQLCSFIPSSIELKRLSCFSCDHCMLSMCYECFTKHTAMLIDEYSNLQKRFTHLNNLFYSKEQSLETFEEHCIRSISSSFDDVISDLERLRQETIDHVKQQFYDSKMILKDMTIDLKPLMLKSQQNWTRDGITKTIIHEFERQREQLNEIENRFQVFTSPSINFQMSTYPRNKIHLKCQLLSNANVSTKSFVSLFPDKIISTQCSCCYQDNDENEKIDIDTEVEEVQKPMYLTKQIQTDPIISDNIPRIVIHNNEAGQNNDCNNNDSYLSTRSISQNILLTQNEVDRISSDGTNLLYFSETSKSLCYITNILSNTNSNEMLTTKEVSCRWPYHSIVDLVYSTVTYQFICATKTGIYTCKMNFNDAKPNFDIKMELEQNCSYVRLSTDDHFLWVWIDTHNTISNLKIYSLITFDCITEFNLKDHSRFMDNSTSFCNYTNLIATLFQYKCPSNRLASQKQFNLTICDSTNLYELCTIYLGECDVDHEIRVDKNGSFFMTNGKRKLWIVDPNGNKEYFKLQRIGRALTTHKNNQVIIANGTQQLQCIEILENHSDIL